MAVKATELDDPISAECAVLIPKLMEPMSDKWVYLKIEFRVILKGTTSV